MKKTHKIVLGILGTILLPVIAYAIQITVPSAPSNGYLLVSKNPCSSNCPYVATTTLTAVVLPLQDTAANLASIVPLSGQRVYETDTTCTKVGDGVKTVSNLLCLNAGQWTLTGSDIYYSTGKVGVGTSSPVATFSLELNGATLPLFVGDQGTSTPFFTISPRGWTGFGTTPTGFFNAIGVKPPDSFATNGVSSQTIGAVKLIAAPGGDSYRAIGNVTAGAAGDVTITGGVGGVPGSATTKNTGGNGGQFNFGSGAGGAPTSTSAITNQGGIGGALSITGGAGGTPTGAGTLIGGLGASMIHTGGAGGSSALLKTGGGGGDVSYLGGAGGQGTSTGGTGGAVTSTGGAGGASSLGTAGAGGALAFIGGTGGDGVTDGRGGDVYIAGGTSPIGDRNGNVLLAVNSFGNNVGNVGIGTTSPYAALSVVGVSGVVADHYVATSTTATSTFANGINLTAGCFSISGTCLSGSGGGGGAVSSVSSSDSSLSISPTTGSVLANLNPSHANVWLAAQSFNGSDITHTFNTINASGGDSASLTVQAGNSYSSSGRVTGIVIDSFGNDTTIATATALWIKNIANGTMTNKYAIAQDSADLPSYFMGNIGIGTTSPYAALSVVGASGVVADHYTATGSATNLFKGQLLVSSGNGTSNFGGGAFQAEIIDGSGSNIVFHLNSGSQNIYIGNGDDPGGSCTVSVACFDSGTGYVQVNTNGSLGVGTTTIGNGATFGVAGNLFVGTSATSTFTQGVNLTNGCFAVNGTCISGSGGGGGSGTVSSGLKGQLAYYNASGSTIVGTSTNPLYVDNLTATSSTATSTFRGNVLTSGNLRVDGTLFTANANGLTINGDGGSGTGQQIQLASSFGANLYYLKAGGSISGFSGTPDTATIYAGNSSKFVANSAGTIPYIQIGDTASNVGINSSVPYSQLSVVGNGQSQIFSAVNASTTLFQILSNGNVGIGTTSPYASLSVAGASGVVANKFYATSTTATSTLQDTTIGSGSTAFTVDYNGKIGIGTTSPFAFLSVQSGDSTSVIEAVATTTTKTLRYTDAKGNGYVGGDLPTLSSCGTNPVIFAGSNNNAGRIQIGSTALQTTCTMTFADAGWTATNNAPACDANIEGGLTIFVAASSTPTTLVFTGGATFTSDFVTYQCKGF